MKEQAINILKDSTTAALTGLGITFAPHEYVGGLFLALAGATFAARLRPERDRTEFVVVILGGFFAAHVAAVVGHIYAPQFPVQIIMAGAGFASRFMARTTLRILGRIEDRSDELGDRVVKRITGDDK